jgi:hypothetical protein
MHLPIDNNKGIPVQEEGEGTVTVVLLVRDSRLTGDDAELRRLFAGLPAQRSDALAPTAVWFPLSPALAPAPLPVDNPAAAQDLDPLDRRGQAMGVGPQGDLLFEEDLPLPLQQLHSQLKRRLGSLASSGRVVSFAKVKK